MVDLFKFPVFYNSDMKLNVSTHLPAVRVKEATCMSRTHGCLDRFVNNANYAFLFGNYGN